MASFLTAEDIVHIEDIVTILVVIAIVLDALARFRQHPSRVPGRFIFERGVAYPVGCRKVRCQCLQRLRKTLVRDFSEFPGDTSLHSR